MSEGFMGATGLGTVVAVVDTGVVLITVSLRAE